MAYPAHFRGRDIVDIGLDQESGRHARSILRVEIVGDADVVDNAENVAVDVIRRALPPAGR